jgi:hypothetical protein
MIFNISGKNIAFGMQWKAILSKVNVHRVARIAKSPLFWQAEKAVYYGLLGSTDKKTKLKGPVYSGAAALIHAYHTAEGSANILLILQMPDDGGFVVCGIHQGRPKDGCDVVVRSSEQVEAVIERFTAICGQSPFLLIGNVELAGISSISLEEFADDVEASAQLRKASNSNVLLPACAIAVVAAAYGASHFYGEFVKVRKKKLAAMASQFKKSSQQLYLEEIAARRLDAALPVDSVGPIVQWVRAQDLSGGGWRMKQISCKPAPPKQLACVFAFERGASPRASYKTFLDWAHERFDTVSFDEGSSGITATAQVKGLPFTTLGAVFDAAKAEREERIELGSRLQVAGEYAAKHTFGKFSPYGIAAGMEAGALAPPLFASADWSLDAPVRRLSEIGKLPPYLVLKSIDFTFTTTPGFLEKSSFAHFSAAGTTFAKK